MTGYERIKAVLEGRKPDRVPMMLHNFMAAAREAGISMEEYRSSPENIARVHLAMARKYGLDGVLMDIDTCMEASAIGVPVDYPREEPARVTGPLSDDIKRLMEAMEPEKLLKSERIKISTEAVHLLKRKAEGELFVRANCDQMAFSLAMLAYGMEDFMADLMDEDCEEQILALIDRACEVHLAYHRLMIEAGADMTSFGDSSCGPDLISRSMYEKFALPFHRKLQKALSPMGVPNLCHICGRLDLILEDVADVGFSAVEIDYKTDLALAVEKLKGRSVVFGPIDPSGVFCLGTPEQVAAETRRVLELFAGRGIVIGAGCALPSTTPEANIRAFADTVRAFEL